MLLVQADSEWLYVVPWGLRKLLVWVDQRYDHPDIYILENGVDCPKESDIPLPGKLRLTMAKYRPAKKGKVELLMVQLLLCGLGLCACCCRILFLRVFQSIVSTEAPSQITP